MKYAVIYSVIIATGAWVFSSIDFGIQQSYLDIDPHRGQGQALSTTVDDLQVAGRQFDKNCALPEYSNDRYCADVRFQKAYEQHKQQQSAQ